MPSFNLRIRRRPAAFLWGFILPVGGEGQDQQDAAHSNCAIDYADHMLWYHSFSGWPSRYKPIEHADSPYWTDFLGDGVSVGVNPAAVQAAREGTPDEWLDHLYGGAQYYSSRCLLGGGAFWEGELHTSQYSIPDMPVVFRTCLCVPASCEREDVILDVLPSYFGEMVGIGSFPPSQPELAGAVRLGRWEDFDLDFIVGGVGGCGTTFMHRTLGRHRQIGFTNTSSGIDEDFFFFDTRRTLPLQDAVERFNGQWGKSRGNRPKILGLYNALMWREPAVRRLLSAIRQVKMILLVCDPLSRFEFVFWQKYCIDNEQEADSPSTASPSTSLCLSQIEEVLRRDPENLQTGLAHSSGKHFEILARLFGDRLYPVHQEYMRNHPHQLFSRLLSFLGATKPFAPRPKFARYNAHRGYRSGLCRNSSLVKRLQFHFINEYNAVDQLMLMAGVDLPKDVLLRTRCDHLEELLSEQVCEKTRCD